MTNNNQICKILIVDNDADYAKKVAYELEVIRPDLLKNHSLEIEISNSAYFVAKHLDSFSDNKAPWDIILSDVYMPIPSTPLDRNTANEEAELEDINYKDQRWKFWEYKYTWNSHLEGTPDHGGLYIAQRVKELKQRNEYLKDLKVVLISDKLIDPVARERVIEFLSSEKSWFNYYDKAYWEENTGDWPKHLNAPDVFRRAVIHAINERESDAWGDFIESPNDNFVVFSKPMQKIVIDCKTLGKDESVNRILIEGERGTGKSLIARKLHEIRMEALGIKAQLVTVECTSISDELFESGLFGHIEGAFTGAIRDKTGFIETAKDGTLFFDEIGDLSPTNQGKILRLLQESQFVKVGSNKNIKMKASLVIFATNKDLERLIEEQIFRDDLYDRLNPPPIEIPPLRERREEIVPLAEHFIKSTNKYLKLSNEARLFLRTQDWKGNVRQLQNTIAKATTFCTSKELKVSDLQQAIPNIHGKNKTVPDMSHPEKHEFTPENILQGIIKWASIKKESYPKRAAIMVAVRDLWQGNQSQLARLLDVKQNSLEQFFSTLRRKYKNKEIKIEDLKPYINRDFHPLLETFFM